METELRGLQSQGIIEPTQHSDWDTTVVVVRKRGGTIRTYGDSRSTVRAMPVARPTVAELHAGGTTFLTLDLTQAYQQLHMASETADVLTINAIKGLCIVRNFGHLGGFQVLHGASPSRPSRCESLPG